MHHQDFTHIQKLPRAIREALNLVYSTSLNDTIYRLVQHRMQAGGSLREVCRHLSEHVFYDLDAEAIRQRYYRAKEQYEEQSP